MKITTLSPIVLWAKAIIGHSPNLSIGVDRMDQLVNPSRTAVLIDQIRFRIHVGTLTGGATSPVPGVGAAIQCRLDLGRLPLTAGRFVPIAALCASLDPTVETNVTNFNGTLGSDTAVAAVDFVWVLPKALYLPPGEVIVPKFMLDGDLWAGSSAAGGSLPLTVLVTMIGRSLGSDAPVPRYINAPFATPWIDAVRVGGSDIVGIRSIRSDLKNPFGEDLFVQRMVGTFGFVPLNELGSSNPYMTGDSIAGVTLTPVDQIGNDKVLAQLFKSDGTQVVRDKTPWEILFPPATRTLDLCGILRRNEWYQFNVDLNISALAATDSIKLMASLIGYRKVEYARGSGFVERE